MRCLRSIFIWIGPIIFVLVLVACSFLYWALGTPSGSRWALITAAQQLDGEVSGISGTIWDGLHVDAFSLALPDITVKLDSFNVQVRWPELLQRRLHVQDISANVVSVDLASSPDQAPGEPFKMPVIPLRIAIDRFAVDELIVRQDGEQLPVSVQNLASSLALNDEGAQLVLQSLELGHEQVHAVFQGEAKVLSLQEPWPLQAQFSTQATGLTADSPLCASHFLPTLPNANKVSASTEPQPCTLDIDTRIDGTVDALKVAVKGAGQGMSLDANASLAPRAAFPLKDAVVALQLADGSSLHGNLDWTSTISDKGIMDRIVGALRTEKLDIGHLVGPSIPPALITASGDFSIQLRDHTDVLDAEVALVFADGSRWNKQALSGRLKGRIVNAAPAPAAAQTTGAPVSASPFTAWQGLQLTALDMDLLLGKNHLQASGALGVADQGLKLNLMAPDLAAFWPDLPGGARLQGSVAGSLSSHKANLTGRYTPSKSKPQIVGSAPIDVDVVLEGKWGKGTTQQDSAEGWRGRISTLKVDHAGLGVRTGAATDVSFLPEVAAPAWQWQVGRSEFQFLMSSQPLFSLSHQGSRGGPGRWETQGAIARLAISPKLISDLRRRLNLQDKEETDRGGVKIKANQGGGKSQIVLGMNWNWKFAGALEGHAHIERLSGDIMVPAEPAFPLGLQLFELDINAKRSNASTSRLTADLQVRTAKMGRVTASASTLLHATPGGAPVLEPKDTKTVKLDADIDDLGWTSLFLDDATELGGAVRANVQLQSRPDGTWESSGTISGQKIRFVRIDDGIRLLDGTLSARLQGNRLILDSLSFPATLRVVPKEWRTAEWLRTNSEAKGGKLTITGDWNLFDSTGTVDVDLYRYPILQRSDRYAMISGKLRVAAELPRMAITGSIIADAGWFDLDMLGGVPTVDNDVVVLRKGETQRTVSAPMDISMDLDVDLGRRVYLTGYGVNSGLVGQMHVAMHNGKLTGIGALRIRGGAIEIYGQRLQLRRGTVTFQGDITSPVLDIEALRTGLPVEAGVRVVGTAKRPRIDLVSYPAVSEIEKLSWLLLGHGADESGGDMALLFSVGTSFLGSGEPFYRKFGIDEVSVKSGELGSVASILPAESVVSGLDSGTSDIEQKFVSVSKKLSNGITLSAQQALSDTGTVGRASYQLARGLTAELTAGTINGLALVYRWFSRD
ncbi:DUF490 domain-containing protein [Candidimonas sp. SYP-B2681]|nr:DUF490 domain-containing protein [Candidimonas sp. SYP-B2681]